MKLCNPEIEMSLVAIVLMFSKCWHQVNFVKPDDFADPFAAQIWEAIGNAVSEGRVPTPHSISMEIFSDEKDQKACAKNLIEWITQSITPLNASDYAVMIKDLADRRRILHHAQDVAALAENTACGLNAAEIASRGVCALMSSQLECADFVPAYEVGAKVIASLDKPVIVFKTGFERLDKAMGGGFYQGRYYGLGARMKSGKSLFMSSLAYNMTMRLGARILYLCLEMGAEESMHRILSMHMGVNSLQFLKSEIRNQDWFRRRTADANQALKQAKLYFRSKPRMTLDDLKATIARAGMSGKVDGVIVDYLQLVEGKQLGQSSAEHFDNVAQTLAEAVKRHQIWILSAAQLNQTGNVRGSEGLLMACDLAFSLNKKEGSLFIAPEGERKDPDRAWLETMVSRYTPYMDVGSEQSPGYEICLDRGPCFVEMKGS
jgi:replicative DNA helicase